jgi:hypothetical protein
MVFYLTISYNKNITCPPSSAGIGNKFITPSIIDNNRDVPENFPAQVLGKISNMALKPPTCL